VALPNHPTHKTPPTPHKKKNPFWWVTLVSRLLLTDPGHTGFNTGFGAFFPQFLFFGTFFSFTGTGLVLASPGNPVRPPLGPPPPPKFPPNSFFSPKMFYRVPYYSWLLRALPQVEHFSESFSLFPFPYCRTFYLTTRLGGLGFGEFSVSSSVSSPDTCLPSLYTWGQK